jgi:hypothetical protein
VLLIMLNKHYSVYFLLIFSLGIYPTKYFVDVYSSWKWDFSSVEMCRTIKHDQSSWTWHNKALIPIKSIRSFLFSKAVIHRRCTLSQYWYNSPENRVYIYIDYTSELLLLFHFFLYKSEICISGMATSRDTSLK